MKKCKLTHQEIADKLKEITVNEYEKEPKDRDWYYALGQLIDELECIEGE